MTLPRPGCDTPGSGNVSRDALNVGLVGATQLDHIPIGIAHEHRNAAVLAKLYRPLRDGDVIGLQGGDRRRNRGDVERDMGVAGIFLADIHQDVLRGITGIGIKDKVDFDALRVADNCDVVALRPVRQRKFQQTIEGDGAVEVAHPDADVGDTLYSDGLDHTPCVSTARAAEKGPAMPKPGSNKAARGPSSTFSARYRSKKSDLTAEDFDTLFNI